MTHPAPKPSAQTGLDLLAMTDLSPLQKAILRAVLRNVRISEPDLIAAINAMSWDVQPKYEDVMAALEDMVNRTYLSRAAERGVFYYGPNLQRKQGIRSMEIVLSNRTSGSMATMWQALQTIGEREQAAGGRLGETVGEWGTKLGQFVRERVGMQAVIVLMIILSAANRFTLSALDVVSTGGIIGELGTEQIPWVTLVEMLVSVLVSGLYLNVIDHLPRVRMMKLLLAIFAGIYLASAVGFIALKTFLPAQVGVVYTLIYLFRSQQSLIFPIVYWNLANNLYNMTAARRVFPFFVAADTVGSLLGYSLFSLPQMLGLPKLLDSANADALLLASVALMLLSIGLVQVFLKEGAEQPEAPAAARPSLLKNLRDGFRLIAEVKLFRYLSLVVALVWMTFSLLVYHFYVVLGNTGNYATNYSLYAIVSTLVFLVLQVRATGYFMKRISTRSAFIALPVTMALMTLPALIFPGLWSGLAVYFVANAIYNAWDAPSFNTLQGLIPEERRGLVVTIVSNYSYALGSILGSLAVGFLVWIPRWAPFIALSESQITTGYLGLALLTALGGIVAAWQVRKHYEESMLSWRLTRRARAASVLDKLEF